MWGVGERPETEQGAAIRGSTFAAIRATLESSSKDKQGSAEGGEEEDKEEDEAEGTRSEEEEEREEEEEEERREKMGKNIILFYCFWKAWGRKGQ